MATLTNFTNVVDATKDSSGNDIPNLKYYGEISENAKLVFDPLQFEAFGKIMRTSSKELSTAIREYYGKTFHDLRGVNIVYAPGYNQPFIIEMYFTKNVMPVPENKIGNLTDLTISNGGSLSLYSKKQIVDNKAAGKHYTLNEETKLLLSDIMYGGRDANKPNNTGKWAQYLKEIFIPTTDTIYNPRAGELMVKVSGCFDIHRVLSKLFGNTMIVKTEEFTDTDGTRKARNVGAECAFEVRFIKYAFNEPSVFIMNIEQFDKESVEKINGKENPVIRTVSGVTYW